MALGDDGGILVKIAADISGLNAGLKEATGGIHEATEEWIGTMEGFKASVEAVMAPLLAFTAVMAAFRELKEVVNGVVETGEELKVMSEKTGMTVESLSQLQYAAKLTSVSNEAMNTGITRLAKNMEESLRVPTSNAALSFKELGVNVKDSSGQLLPVQDVLLQVSEKMKGMTNDSERLAYAQEIFGRGGAALLPLLKEGAEGIKKMSDESDALGNTWSGKDVAASEQFRVIMVQLHAEWNGFIRDIVINGFPYLEGLIDIIKSLILEFEAWAWIIRGVFDTLELHWEKAEQDADTAALKLMQAGRAMIKAFDEPVPEVHQEGSAGGGNNPKIKATEAVITAMQRFQEELDKLKIANAGSYGDMTRIELEFWQTKLATVAAGSKEYIDILHRIADLSLKTARDNDDALQGLDNQFTEARKNNYDKRMAGLKAEEQLQKGHLDEVRRLAEEEYILAGNQYGIGSPEQLAALGHFYDISNQITKKLSDDWGHLFDSLHHGFSDTISQMQKTGGTFGQFMKQMSMEVLRDFIASEIKKQEVKAASWLAQNRISAIGAAEEVALSAWAGLKIIATYAAQAAAGAWAAIASIPYVGPFLAPAAAAATLAGVLMLAKDVKSAAGGYDIPGNLNPLVQAHASEMVLPASIADGFRNIIKANGGAGGGAGGGGGTVIIQAFDASDVHRFMMKHAPAVAAAAYHAGQNGVGFRQQVGRRG